MHLISKPIRQRGPQGVRHIGNWLVAAGLATGLVAPACADTADATVPAAAATTDNWSAVDDAALDGARGGFTNGNGLMVSLGIDRLVSINGDVVARTRIEIADLSRIGADQARQTSEALSAVKLVQNGGENIYRAGEIGSALGGIIVQNSLNNQVIRTDTVISSTVNSAGLLNALNFQGTLQNALTRAVGSQP
ncbi:MAG: hypothetical protein JWP59_241 [Massilia sp.]|nr:hypothetical protein [Massilia sp.]